MGPAHVRSERRSAAAFLAVTAPLSLAIAGSGGLLALVPLLLLIVPILLVGTAPGLEALETARRRLSRGRTRRPRARRARIGFPLTHRLIGSPVAGPFAGRGPPLPTA
jgi:hypothetical protein